MMQMPLRLPGLGTRYAGAAVGMVTSWSALFGFLMLPYMFTPIWENLGAFWPALFLCLSLWLAGLLFVLAPEVGRKYMIRMLTQAQEEGAPAS